MNALLVDDSESVRHFLRDVLANLGYGILEAENGHDALAQLSAAPLPAIAFVDRQMPLMDGLDFVKAVRSDTRYNAMRIVMCSGPLSPAQEGELPKASIARYLPKPLNRDLVKKTVTELIPL